MARQFDGTDDVALCVDPAGVSFAGGWAMGAWAWPDSLGRSVIAVGGDDEMVDRGALLAVQGNGTARVFLAGSVSVISSATVGTGEWHRISAMRADGVGTQPCSVIVDGVATTQNSGAPTDIATGDAFMAGRAKGDKGIGWWQGRLAWVFWLDLAGLSPAPTAAEIDAILLDPVAAVELYGARFRIFNPLLGDDNPEPDFADPDNNPPLSIVGTTAAEGPGVGPSAAGGDPHTSPTGRRLRLGQIWPRGRPGGRRRG